MAISVGEVEATLRLKDEMSLQVAKAMVAFKAAMDQAGSAAASAAPKIKTVSDQLNQLGDTLQKNGRAMSDAGTGLTKALTVPLTLLGGGAIKAAIDFESSFAGVRKTMKATEAEFAAMSEGIRDLARTLPIGVNELNRLAMMAGQLGISKEHIVGFVDVAAKLGSVTTMSADDAANGLARLRNIMGTAETDIGKMGSALVALGNAGASSEQEILDMSLRIAAAGTALHMSEGDVMGFANALSSVGIHAEMGGSAMSRLMLRISEAVRVGGDSLEKFANVARMSSDAFAASFNKDAAGALVQFAVGMRQSKEEGINLLSTMADLDVNEVRMRQTLLGLAASADKLKDSVDLGNTSFKEGTALNKAFEERMKTTAAQMKVLFNNLYDVGIELGTAFLPILKDVVKVAKDFVEPLKDMAHWFSELPEPVRATALGLGLFLAALGPALYLSGQLVISIGALVKAFGLLAGEQGIGAVVSVGPKLGGIFTGIEAVLAGSPFLQMLLFGGMTGLVIGGAIALVAHQADQLQADLERVNKERLGGSGTNGGTIPGAGGGRQGNITLLPESGGLLSTTDAMRAFNGEAVRIRPILGVASTAMATAARTTFGFSDTLKEARAKIAALSPALRDDLAKGIQSGAFDMDELKKRTGLSEFALKLFEDQVKKTGKAVGDDLKEDLRTAEENMDNFRAAAVRAKDAVSDAISWIKPRFKEGTNQLDVSATFGGATPGTGIEGIHQIKAPDNFATSSSGGVTSGINLESLGMGFVESEGGLSQMASQVDNFAQSLVRLAQVSGDTFGGIVKAISQVVVSFGMGINATQHMKSVIAGETDGNKNMTGRATAAFESLTSVWAATEGGGAAGMAGGAMAGAMSGAAMGMAFAPHSMGTSIVIGAIAGAIIGYLRTSHMKADLKDLGREWGVTLSDELVKTIQKDAARLGELPAMLLSLDKVINEAGGVGAFGLDKAIAKTRDLFVMFETGKLTAHAVGGEFNTVFGMMLPEAIDKTTGLAKKSFLELIDLAKRFGIASEAANEFIVAQSKNVATGLNLVSQGVIGVWNDWIKNNGELGNALGTAREKVQKLQAQIDDLNDKKTPWNEKDRANLQIWTRQLADAQTEVHKLEQQFDATGKGFDVFAKGGQDAFDRVGRMANVTFMAMIGSGSTLRQTLDAIGPTLDTMSTAASTFGFTSSGAVAELLKINDFAKNNKDTLDTLDGLNLMMSGLNNIGLLTQGTFNDIGATASETFQKMVDGGLTGDQAMALMQPTLQTIWQLQKDYGFTLDANTQKLVDQAVEAGIVGEKHKTEGQRMVEAMEGVQSILTKIADFMGVNLIAAAQTGADGVERAFDSINPHVRVGFEYDNERNGGPDAPVIEMAAGGAGRATGPTWFYSAGNEDFAFSGEGGGFGGGGGGDTELHERVDDLQSEISQLRRDFTSTIPNAIAKATAVAFVKAGR